MAKNGAKTNDSTAISLIRMFREGAEVSLSGSPIVSPITAALWGPTLLDQASEHAQNHQPETTIPTNTF